MAIFRREDGAGGQATQGPGSPRATRREPDLRATTLIAPGSKVEGTVQGTTEVLVEGTLAGKAIIDGRLVIGAKGLVEGDVEARSVTVAGRIVGNISASERVELTSSGRIEGDVRAPRVAIAEGGFCQGRIEMTGGQGDGAAPAREATTESRDQRARSAAGEVAGSPASG